MLVNFYQTWLDVWKDMNDLSESNEEDEWQDSYEEIEESQVMDKLKRSFFTLYDKLKNKITKTDNLKKSVKSFTKSLDRLATASDSRVAKLNWD